MAPPELLPYEAGLWDRVGPVWEQLLANTRQKTAFLSSDWVGAWIEVFGHTLRPVAVVWRDSEREPVGCALIPRGRGRFGPFPVHRSFLNASGVGQIGCEHNDLLALPTFRDRVLWDLVRMVLRNGTDEFALEGLSEQTARDLASRWPLRATQGFLSDAPYVDLERLRAAESRHLACLSSNTRGQIRRSLGLYEKKFGPLSLEVAERRQVPAWFDQMVALHERRWTAKGHPGAFATEASRRFHRSVLERSAGSTEPDRLAADVVRVRFGDEIVGFLYNLRFHGHVSFYQSGLRYNGDPRLKPGLVAHHLAIEHYLDQGESEYDFLGGEPEPVRYKRSLTTDVRRLAWIRLPAPGPKMRLLAALSRGRHRARSVLAKE